MRLGFGALILFITNLVTIQAAASGVFWFYGLHAPLRGSDRGLIELCRRNGISLGLLVALGIFLAFTFQNTVGKNQRNQEIRRMLSAAIQLKQQGSTLDDLNIKDGKNGVEVFAVVRTPNSFIPEQVAEMENLLNPYMGIKIQLFVRSVITKEASSQGWLHVPASNPQGDANATTAFPGDGPAEEASGPNVPTTPINKPSTVTPSPGTTQPPVKQGDSATNTETKPPTKLDEDSGSTGSTNDSGTSN